jgi:hypothetical protein
MERNVTPAGESVRRNVEEVGLRQLIVVAR